MRGAATQAMSDIVEERQQSRYAPFAAAPLRAAARRPAGFVARSSHTTPGTPWIARRSRTAIGPRDLQPVIPRSVIAQELSWPTVIADQQVRVAVIVVVSHCQASSYALFLKGFSKSGADIHKLAAGISKQ